MTLKRMNVKTIIIILVFNFLSGCSGIPFYKGPQDCGIDIKFVPTDIQLKKINITFEARPPKNCSLISKLHCALGDYFSHDAKFALKKEALAHNGNLIILQYVTSKKLSKLVFIPTSKVKFKYTSRYKGKIYKCTPDTNLQNSLFSEI